MSTNDLHECLECGVDYPPRRSVQKYCSTKCRNRKNNRRYKSINQDTRTIDRILHRNYQILKSLQVDRLTRNELELTSLGFNLKYYTHQSRTTNKDIIFCLYDIGYCYGTGNLIHIIQLEN